MIMENIKKICVAAALCAMLPSLALATPADDCLALDGMVDEAGFCVATVVEAQAFSRMTRPAGDSGLGWTVVGVATTTTVAVYELETIPGGTTEVFVAGDPTLPGCQNANNTPRKCTDHYQTVTGEDTYMWLEIFRESNTVFDNLSCLNPANKDMGQHRQCGF